MLLGLNISRGKNFSSGRENSVLSQTKVSTKPENGRYTNLD
jgi:hypothetical protein